MSEENPGLDRSAAEMDKRAEIERKARHRAAMEKKAFSIVVRLAEVTVSPDEMTELAEFIDPQHYADIVEERSIYSVCGYPLCSEPLVNVPKQRFKIHLKEKRVYDITERKKYCTDKCFAASSHLVSQISTIPVWLRDQEPVPMVTILSKDEVQASPGDKVLDLAEMEVIQQLKDLNVTSQSPYQQKAKNDESNVPNLDSSNLGTKVDILKTIDVGSPHQKANRTANTALMELQFSELKIGKLKPKENLSVNSAHAMGPLKQTSDTDELLKCKDGLPDQTSKNSLLRGTVISEPHDRNGQLNDMQPRNPADVVKSNSSYANKLKSDFAVKEHRFAHVDADRATSANPASSDQCISTSQKFKPSVDLAAAKPQSLRRVIKRYLKEWSTPDTVSYLLSEDREQLVIEERLEQLSQVVKLQEIEEKKRDRVLLEDRGAGGEPGKDSGMGDMAVKVREFYKGRFYEIESGVAGHWIDGKSTADLGEPVLPPVDHHSQMAIRRRILQDRVNTYLPDALDLLRLTSHDVSMEIRQIIQTFRPSALNLNLKPEQWTLMCMVILWLLKDRINAVEQSISKSTTFCDLLASCGFTKRHLAALHKSLTGQSESLVRNDAELIQTETGVSTESLPKSKTESEVIEISNRVQSEESGMKHSELKKVQVPSKTSSEPKDFQDLAIPSQTPSELKDFQGLSIPSPTPSEPKDVQGLGIPSPTPSEPKDNHGLAIPSPTPSEPKDFQGLPSKPNSHQNVPDLNPDLTINLINLPNDNRTSVVSHVQSDIPSDHKLSEIGPDMSSEEEAVSFSESEADIYSDLLSEDDSFDYQTDSSESDQDRHGGTRTDDVMREKTLQELDVIEQQTYTHENDLD